MKNLRSKNEAGRKKAAHDILNQRKEIISALIKAAEEEYAKEGDVWEGKRGPKSAVNEMLGQLRATEAIPVLLKDITPRPGQAGKIMEMGSSLASWALVRIGTPAAKSILSELTNNLDEGRREIYCKVLIGVCTSISPNPQLYGIKLAKEAVRLKIDSETDAKKKANLEKALKYIDHHIKIRTSGK